jgi:hypothetical protein
MISIFLILSSVVLQLSTTINVVVVSAFSASATLSQFPPPPPSRSNNNNNDNNDPFWNSDEESNDFNDHVLQRKSNIPVYNDVELALANRRYQLEEQEDIQLCLTEIRLLGDHSLVMGQSDGPIFDADESYGIWSYNDVSFSSEVAFAMKLRRVYKYNSRSSSSSSLFGMGEFSFTVCRVYVGELIQVGNVVGVEGSIYELPEEDEEEEDDIATSNDLRTLLGITSTSKRVGFFSMIDTTPSSQEEDDEDDEQPNDQIEEGSMMI